MSKTDSIEQELEAMTTIAGEMRSLEETQKRRVLRWVLDTYAEQPASEPARPAAAPLARKAKTPRFAPPAIAPAPVAAPGRPRTAELELVHGPKTDSVRIGKLRVGVPLAEKVGAWVREKAKPQSSMNVAIKFGIETATASVRLRAAEFLGLIVRLADGTYTAAPNRAAVD